MLTRALVFFLLLAIAAHADAPVPPATPPVLPPALQQLQQSLARANAAEQAAQQQWQAEAKHQQAALRQLTATTATLIRNARTPRALATLQALAAELNRPTAASATTLTGPGLLAASAAFQQQDLAGLRQKLARLAQLQQQAADQLTALTALQTQYTAANTQLSQQQTAALSDAALQADTLAATLGSSPTQSISSTLTTAPSLATEKQNLPSIAGSPVLPVLGKIITAFRQPGSTRPDGLTFRATAPGAPVVSLGGGKVDYAGPFLRFGGLVIVSSKGTDKTDRWANTHVIYANLSDLAVNAGATVQPGTVLGHLAAAPAATLYFEVRRRGQPVNPATFLPSNS